MKELLSFGAGVQSTTLLLMSCKGVLPKLDAAIFADTQWEPKEVYRHLEWCKEQAAKAGIAIEVRSAGNIHDDILDFWGQKRSADGKRHATIPAFVKNPDGSKGIVRRQCSREYKIEVIERFVRQDVLGLRRGQRWPLEPVIRQWIGISHDESHRMRDSDRPAVVHYYPLIETLVSPRSDALFEMGYSRQDCLDWMKANGFPQPPRSACIGCPFHSDAEWARMKEHDPEAFASAVSLDHSIRVQNTDRIVRTGKELRGQPYLHASLVPLGDVVFKTGANERQFGNECTGMCGN